MPLAFGVNGRETRLFTSAFHRRVQCGACMVWSFAIGRFPHQFWFVSLIFTRHERNITSGQNTAIDQGGKSKKIVSECYLFYKQAHVGVYYF